MHLAIRSPIVLGITLAGAGAIAVSPIAANPPDVHLPAVRLTATTMHLRLENPIRVFTPILQQTLQDSESLLTQEINDPFPIVRGALLDVRAALQDLARLIGPQPFVGTTAAATAGQPIPGGALIAPTDPVGSVANPVQGFLQQQLMVASRLLTAVPTAAIGVTVSTVNAFVRTTRAVLRASIGVVRAVATLNPVRVVNSVIDGTALVARVVEHTTIGFNTTTGQPQSDVGTPPSISRVDRIPSIAQSIDNGRLLIANALSPQKRAARAPVTGAQVAVSSATGTPAASSTTDAAPAAKVPAAKVAAKAAPSSTTRATHATRGAK